MNDFRFYTPTRYIFGRKAEDEAGRISKELLGRKVMIVFGEGSARRSGLLDSVEKSLQDAGVTFIEFGGIKPNPTDSPVRQGIEICRNEHITGLLAVGGGSVIDTAKAIAAGVPYNGDFWDFFSGKCLPETALPVGVVLTIPAAGSEGSGNSVITLEDGLKKLSIRTDSVLRPRFALIDPELTYSLPHYQTACGVVDMMAHIFERYFTPSEGVEVTDRISEGLLKAIVEEAPKVMEHPDNYDARANIMWAGTLAHNGICGTGKAEDWTSHAMEHEVSAIYGVAHGAGLAVILPAYMTFMAHHKPLRVAMMARNVFDIENHDDRSAAMEGISALKAFFMELGMPVTFSQLGIPNPDIPLLVNKLHENKGPEIGAYYRLNATDTTAIYRLAL